MKRTLLVGLMLCYLSAAAVAAVAAVAVAAAAAVAPAAEVSRFQTSQCTIATLRVCRHLLGQPGLIKSTFTIIKCTIV